MFWLQLLSKVHKLSLVYRLGLPDKFEARRIKFELKEREKGLSQRESEQGALFESHVIHLLEFGAENLRSRKDQENL